MISVEFRMALTLSTNRIPAGGRFDHPPAGLNLSKSLPSPAKAGEGWPLELQLG